MKQIQLSIFMFFCFGLIQAQAPNCFNAYLSPFCSGIDQYAANFDGTGSGSGPQAPSGPNYDCLGTQGNPTYFSLTIQQSGSINFTLDNTANVDIDFILWGPFSSIADATNSCDSMGTGGTWGNVSDCSYSIFAQEPVSIPNAISGEVYILMVTNYANVATNIFSTPNSGTGTVACPCDIPSIVDTLSSAFGNQGYLTDSTGSNYQFLVCPNQTLGFEVQLSASINDSLSLYVPFTTINTVFTNQTTLSLYPNNPLYDSLNIYTLITPGSEHIGVNNFTMGFTNKIYTGNLNDSSCFDQLDFEVVVPGVKIEDRTICSGETINVLADSIPATSQGSSSYSWSQIGGIPVTLNNTTGRNLSITIPILSATNNSDSVVIEVDYSYGSLCPMKDTFVLYFTDAQIDLTLSQDSICSGQSTNLLVVLSDTLSPGVCDDYDIEVIPFAPVGGSGTLVSLSDDALSGALNVGFDFEFYCNIYNSFYISSNGFITFNAGSGNGCCSGQIMPDPFPPNDLIALCWTDCNPSAGGTISYLTSGVAPNRQLIVNFANVPPFSANSGNQSVQAILFEGTNIIEIHVSNATPSGFFNTLSIGLENSLGNDAHPAPGVNATTNSISNTAFRFSPKNYGPFYSWTPVVGLDTTSAPNVTATPNATSIYYATVLDGNCTYYDSITINVVSALATPQILCDSSNSGSIFFSWSAIALPPGGYYEYSLDGGLTWTNAGTALNASVSGLNANESLEIAVRANDGSGGSCPLSLATFDTCTTLGLNCNPINIQLNGNDLDCFGDNDGCIVALVNGIGNNSNYIWSNGQQNVDSICGLSAGTYQLVVVDTISSGGNLVNTTLYSEAFDGTHNWTLNVPTGTNDADNNYWEVDSDEAGQPVGNCGAAGGSNRTLHITSQLIPSGGAAYNTGGFCPIFCTETHLRAESPGFSTLNQTNLTLEFNYIANGSALIDNASLYYNAGNGWQQLDPSLKSSVCGSGQGLWTKYSTALPASCENKANVQIGFNWDNNDDLVGTDPSVAIDSIVVRSSTTPSSFILCTDSATFTINAPAELILNLDSIANPSCDNNDGIIVISGTGGTTPYVYTWNGAVDSSSNNALSAGNYSIVVIDDNNCTDTLIQALTIPNQINASIDNQINISCDDSTDIGAITVNASGGNGSLNFLWSNGTSTEDLNNLAAGNYSLTITDSLNCSLIISTDITQDTAVSVEILPIIQSLNCAQDPIGVLSALASGGSDFTYNWSNGNNTAIVSGLTAGTYSLTVTNANNCSNTATDSILSPQVPFVNPYINSVGTDSISIAQNTSVTLFSGSTGFNYLWSAFTDPADGNPGINQPNSDSTLVNPDPQGVYTYIITASITSNDTTCSVSDSLVVLVESVFDGIPDAFTPNGDGTNDYFTPVGLSDGEVLQFRVYNRWSQEIYNGDDTHGDGWDGNYMGVPQPTDVYIYLIEYKKVGDTASNTLKGEVTLIR